MKKEESLNFKKRAKQTLALFLSGLLLVGVLSVPVRADAKDYEVTAGDTLALGTGSLFVEGDTLYVGNHLTNPSSAYRAYRVNYTVYESAGVFYEGTLTEAESKPIFDVAVGDTGVYYIDGTFHFSKVVPDAAGTPDTVKNIAENYLSIYKYLGNGTRQDVYYYGDERHIGGYDLYFELVYGFRVEFEGDESDSQYCYYSFGDGFYLNEHSVATPEAGPYLDDFSTFIGWSNNEDYVDESSEGFFIEPGDPVPMDGMLSYLDANKTLTLYPVYESAMRDQENVTFDCPDGMYVGQYSFDPSEYMTGLQEDPVVHYQLFDTRTSDYMALDQIADKAYESMYIQLTAEATDHFNEYKSNKTDYTVKVSWGPQPDTKCTMEGNLSTQSYDGCPSYTGPVTITAPEGYLFFRDYFYFRTDNDSFVDSLTLSEDGYYDLTGYFRRISDGAVSERTTLVDGPGEIYVDTHAPKMMNVVADGEETVIPDNLTFEAQTLEFRVYDFAYTVENSDFYEDGYVGYYETLQSVTVDGVNIPFAEGAEGDYVDVTLSNTLPGDKSFVVKATDIFGQESSWTITLKYVPENTPNPPYVLSGTEGDGEYYKSDVILTPADGYTVTDDYTKSPENYEDSLTFEENTGDFDIYLYNPDSGKYTEKITVPGFKIDKADPVIASVGTDQDGASVDLSDGASIRVKTVTFTVEDANLSLVTLDGDAVPISGGKATITLSAGYEEKEYEIRAKDEAGREVTRTITLEVYGTAQGTVSAKTNLVYNGSEQALVTPGTPVNGEFVYSQTEDGDYLSVIPTGMAPGTYTVWYKVSGDEYYLDSEPVELTVTIAQKQVGITWTNTEFIYDGEEHGPTATLTGIVEGDVCTFTVTGDKATDLGSYTATVTGLSNENYKLPLNPSTAYVIKNPEKKEEPKKAGTVTISMAGFYYGGKPTSPSIGSKTNDVSKAVIRYRNEAGVYFDTVPTAVGTYTVSVTLPATGDYLECSASAGFTISYLPVPEGAYSLEGTKGDGEWYTSYIEVVPAEGYEISYAGRDNFSTKPVRFDEGMEGGTVYIRNTLTGEQTAGILIANLLIDVTAPEISDMEKDQIYYADEDGRLIGFASDKNIDKVLIDGIEVPVTLIDGINSFDLPFDKKKQKVEITVTDKAGNTTTITIITAPAWMKEGVVGDGEYYLETGTQYKTSSSGNTTLDGDPNVYNAGITFYAKREGDHTFHCGK